MARDELNTVYVAKGEKLHQSPRLKTSGAFSISSHKHKAAVSPGKVSGRHLRWMQEAGMWDGWKNARTGLLHSGNTPSSPFNSFHNPVQLWPFWTPQQFGIQLILLSRGRALHCAPSSRGQWANTKGGRRPALASALLWHILTWPPTAKQPPKASIRKRTEGIFPWTEDTQFRRFRVYVQGHVSLCVHEIHPHC